MKKILLACFIILLATSASYAGTVGMYKSETEYGLFDGFKFNILNRKYKDQKFVELKSETVEEKERLEREKIKPSKPQDEYQLIKFLQDDTIAL